MTSLDPRSLIVMGNVMALIMGAVLGFMQRQYPRDIHGLRQWAAMPAVWIMGAILYLVPPPVVGQLALLVANGCVLAGFGLFHLGCRHFLGVRRMERPFALILAALVAVLGWFTWSWPSYPSRLVVVTAAIAALHAWTLALLWRRGTRSLATYLVQCTLLVHLVILLVRLQTAVVSRGAAGDLMEPSGVHTFYIGAYVFTVLLLSIGAVLLATERMRTEFEHMATHDGLTGALNRRAILAFCEEEHARALRQPQPFSLLMLDLDHFKTVNDTHGHQHGDRVLVHFVQTVQASLRRTDRLGRYGGEEFVALLPAADAAAAGVLAQRIHAALSSGHPLDCKVSIGLTHWQGAHDSVDAMLARADAALYRAKAQGRNQTCVG